ncbi:NUDIX hydrolase [Streptomyces sp. NPDC001155]
MTTRYSIECWITNPDQGVLLLQVPARPGKYEAFWQPITGGIEDGETPLQAALREIREETGLKLTESQLIEIAANLVVVISPEETIIKTLYAASTPDAKVITNPLEHQAHQWLPPAQVADVLFWGSNRDTWKLVRQPHGDDDGPEHNVQ